jgi:hypothetical protein
MLALIVCLQGVRNAYENRSNVPYHFAKASVGDMLLHASYNFLYTAPN